MKIENHPRIKAVLVVVVLTVALCGVRIEVARRAPIFLGVSREGSILNISPDGKWMLSWNGMLDPTFTPTSSDHFVWDLATNKPREVNGGFGQDCGWTPDNRIWTLDRAGPFLGDGNPPYSPWIDLENPDGSGKITCHDSRESYDYEGNAVDYIMFSVDGRQMLVFTKAYWYRFDAHTGKLRERRIGSSIGRAYEKYLQGVTCEEHPKKGSIKLPSQHGPWQDAVRSRDKRWVYAINSRDEIYRFVAP